MRPPQARKASDFSALETGPSPIFSMATASLSTISFQTKGFPCGEGIRVQPRVGGPDFCPGPPRGWEGPEDGGLADHGLILAESTRQGCFDSRCPPRHAAPGTERVLLFPAWNNVALQTRSSLLASEPRASTEVTQLPA